MSEQVCPSLSWTIKARPLHVDCSACIPKPGVNQMVICYQVMIESTVQVMYKALLGLDRQISINNTRAPQAGDCYTSDRLGGKSITVKSS